MISASEIIIDLDSQKYYPPQATQINIINDNQMEQEVEPIIIESSESEQLNGNTHMQQLDDIEDKIQKKNDITQMEVEGVHPPTESNNILEENLIIYQTGAFSFGQPLENSLKLSIQEETAKNFESNNQFIGSNEMLREVKQTEDKNKLDEESKSQQFLLFLNEGQERINNQQQVVEERPANTKESKFESESEKNEEEVLFHPDIPFAQLRNNYSNNPFIQELISNLPQTDISPAYVQAYPYDQEKRKIGEEQEQIDKLRQELMNSNFAESQKESKEIDHLQIDQKSALEGQNENEREENRKSEGKMIVNEELIKKNMEEPNNVQDFNEIEGPEVEEKRIKQFFGEPKNEDNFDKNEQNVELFGNPKYCEEIKADQQDLCHQNPESSERMDANEEFIGDTSIFNKNVVKNSDFLENSGENEKEKILETSENKVETLENKLETLENKLEREIEESKTEKLDESNFQDKIIEAIANDQAKIENPEGLLNSSFNLPVNPLQNEENKSFVPNESEQPQQTSEQSIFLNPQSNFNEEPLIPQSIINEPSRILNEPSLSNINEEVHNLEHLADPKKDDQIEILPEKISEDPSKENQLTNDLIIREPINDNLNANGERMDIEQKAESQLPLLNADEEGNKEELVSFSKKIKKMEGKKLRMRKKRVIELKDILKGELEEKLDASIQKNLRQFFYNYKEMSNDSPAIFPIPNFIDFKTQLTADLFRNLKKEIDQDLPFLRQEVSEVKNLLKDGRKNLFDQEFPVVKEDLTFLKKNQQNIYNELPELKRTLMEINKETLIDNAMLIEMNKMFPQLKQDLFEMRDLNKVSTNFLANEFNKEIPVIKQDLLNVKNYMTQDLMGLLSSEINKEIPIIKMNLGDLRIYQKESAAAVKAIGLDMPQMKQDLSELRKTVDNDIITTIASNIANLQKSLNSNVSDIKKEMGNMKQSIHSMFREIICVKEDVHLENKNSTNFKNFNRSSFQLLQQFAIYIKTYEFSSDRGSLGIGILVEWIEDEKNIKVIMTNKQLLKKNMNIDLILKDKPANSELRGKCKVKGFLHQKSELAFIEVTTRIGNGFCAVNYKDIVDPEMGKKKKRKTLRIISIGLFMNII